MNQTLGKDAFDKTNISATLELRTGYSCLSPAHYQMWVTPNWPGMEPDWYIRDYVFYCNNGFYNPNLI